MKKSKRISQFSRVSFLSFMITMAVLISLVLPQPVSLAKAHEWNDWQLEMIGANQAHEEGYKGEGINIAVVDDKFDGADHGDLVTAVVEHITPGATILQYGINNEAGKMTSDALAAAIETATKDQVDIINISLGTEKRDSIVEAAIEAALKKNIIIVASSGNDGKHEEGETSVYYPAAHEDVISVGAVGEDGTYLRDSNYGQVKAPGEFYYSEELYGGTSIAAPYVAGLIALYMNQQNSKDVKSFILNNKNDQGIVQYLPVELKIDKLALQAEIERAEKILAEEYTADSYANLMTALEAARDVNQAASVEQEVVDQAKDALQKALTKLVELDEKEEANRTDESKEDQSSEQEKPNKDEELKEAESESSESDDKPTTPSLITIEVDKAEPTFIGPKQKIKFGQTNSSLVTPADLPAGVTMTVDKVKDTDDRVQAARNVIVAGDIYTINLENVNYTDLKDSFTLTLNYDKNLTDKPAIYYYNEANGEWEYRGGELDEATRTISVEVDHFSTYGVFVAKEQSTESEAIVPNLDYKKDPSEPIITIDEERETTARASNSGDKLPETASNLYSYMATGLLFLAFGLSLALLRRRTSS